MKAFAIAIWLYATFAALQPASAAGNDCRSIADATARSKCYGDSRKSDLGAEDLDEMHSTYEKNQARFFRNFKGKKFTGALVFDGFSENAIFRGVYRLQLKSKSNGGGFMGEVGCRISDRKTIDYLTDFDKGDPIEVIGIVEDHSFGAVDLIKCQVHGTGRP